MAYFDAWRPSSSDTVVESDWKRFCPYSPQSLPLVLPSAADASQTLLPLFGAASASTSGSGLPASTDDAGPSTSAAAEAAGLSTAEAKDVLLYAGGPMWGLDWCPASSSNSGGNGNAATDRACDYLAVACHPLGAEHNVIGTLVKGPACIQVWQVSHPEQQAPQQQRQQSQASGSKAAQQQRPAGLQLPRMAMALAYDGGLCWQCQWCPDPGLADGGSAGGSRGTIPRLGLIAAALGDGSVRVWAVPHPQATQQLRPATASTASAQPLVLSLPALAACSSGALGGSLPCLVDWLPSAPYDLLAVGCWDGSLAIFKLTPGNPQRQQQQQQAANGSANGSNGNGESSSSMPLMYGMELLSHFAADTLPLRVVRWLPPTACGATIDMLHRNIVFTAGHEGSLRVWDLRDTFQPHYSHTLSINATILSGDWTSRPFGIVVALEDASLRGVLLDSTLIARSVDQEKKAMFSISWRGPNMGALWSVAVQPDMQLVAYGGEDGEVGMFPAGFEANSKRRKPHNAVAAVRMEDGALFVKQQRALEKKHGLFVGKVVERMPNLKAARLPDALEAVHRVAWSRQESDGCGAWLASGGAAGLARLQWIQSK